MPAGCVIAVVGAVGSEGYPDAGGGGGGGTVWVVAGTVSCAIAALVDTAHSDNVAKLITISEKPFISYLFLGKSPVTIRCLAIRFGCRSAQAYPASTLHIISKDLLKWPLLNQRFLPGLGILAPVSENLLTGESQFDQCREDCSMSLSSIANTRISFRASIALLGFAISLSMFAPAPTWLAPPATVPPMKGIAHIVIRVKNIAASVDFFQKLGFDQAFANSGKDDTVSQSVIGRLQSAH